jgi:hypothetical protein
LHGGDATVLEGVLEEALVEVRHVIPTASDCHKDAANRVTRLPAGAGTGVDLGVLLVVAGVLHANILKGSVIRRQW